MAWYNWKGLLQRRYGRRYGHSSNQLRGRWGKEGSQFTGEFRSDGKDHSGEWGALMSKNKTWTIVKLIRLIHDYGPGDLAVYEVER